MKENKQGIAIPRISLTNFRKFKNNGFNFKPLTILVGENSSGKSTVLKSIKFLKENIENNFFPYYLSNQTDLGDFKKIQNYKAADGLISYSLLNWTFTYKEAKKPGIKGFSVLHRMTYLSEKYGNELVFHFDNRLGLHLENVVFDFKEIKLSKTLETLLEKFLEEKDRMLEYWESYKGKQNLKLKNLDSKQEETLREDFKESLLNINTDFLKKMDECYDEKKNSLTLKIGERVGDIRSGASIYELISFINNSFAKEFGFGPFKEACENIQSLKSLIDPIISLIQRRIQILDRSAGMRINNSFFLLQNLLGSKVKFVPSVRGGQDRFHTNDSFIGREMIDYKVNKSNFTQEQRRFLTKWLNEFGCGQIFSRGSSTHFEIILRNKQGNINIADLGYGYTELIPIILAIVNASKSNHELILLEEPECNLHPKFQTKIAELLVDAHNIFNMQFIVETHSEYLVRKMQLIVKKKDGIKKDQINLFCFSESNEIIKQFNFLENGQFDNKFSDGFMNEAALIHNELMKE